MGGKRFIQVLGLLAVFLLSGVVTSAANATTIKTSATEFAFVDGPFVQAPGDLSVLEIPVEGAPHNVTATTAGPDRAALFESETILGGNTTPISGTQYLEPGTYPFICTLHSPGMSGDLLVEGSGPAVPRPSVSLTVPAQKLKQVKKSGKVKVKVKASTLSNGIVVDLLKGVQKLAPAVRLDMPAGTSKTVSVKLSGAGKKAVKKVKQGKKLQISVAATVPYGKPTKASRTIR